jgi:putative RecB family exonuclease
MARGTLVHTVLEDIFDLPPAERTLTTAVGLVAGTWQRIVDEEPELARVVGSGSPEDSADAAAIADWLSGADPLLATYFRMEDPRHLNPAYRELHVEVPLPDGPVLRGFIDRVDIHQQAGIRIVDYKTGRAPGPRFEQKAMFQLRFYALVIWRMTGELPALLQLTYLGSGEYLRLVPEPEDLTAFETKVRVLWDSIVAVYDSGEWSPKPSRLCDWCSFQRLCPAKGGEALPLPEHARPETAGNPRGAESANTG